MTTMQTTEPAYLTMDEQEELLDHESIIDQSQALFIEVGNSLMAIRDAKLYRATHASFEQYLAERWPAISKRRGYQLIDAAAIAKDVPITNERQARALKNVPVEQAKQAYEAASVATNGAPTARAIEQALIADRDPGYHALQKRARAIGLLLSYHDDRYDFLDTDGEHTRLVTFANATRFVEGCERTHQIQAQALAAVAPTPEPASVVAMPQAPDSTLTPEEQALLLANGWTPAKGYTSENGFALLGFSYRGGKPVIEVAAYWRRVIRNIGNRTPGTNDDYAAIVAEEALPSQDLISARRYQSKLTSGMHNLEQPKDRQQVRQLCADLLDCLNTIDGLPSVFEKAVEAVLTSAADILSDYAYSELRERLEGVVTQ